MWQSSGKNTFKTIWKIGNHLEKSGSFWKYWDSLKGFSVIRAKTFRTRKNFPGSNATLLTRFLGLCSFVIVQNRKYLTAFPSFFAYIHIFLIWWWLFVWILWHIKDHISQPFPSLSLAWSASWAGCEESQGPALSAKYSQRHKTNLKVTWYSWYHSSIVSGSLVTRQSLRYGLRRDSHDGVCKRFPLRRNQDWELRLDDRTQTKRRAGKCSLYHRPSPYHRLWPCEWFCSIQPQEWHDGKRVVWGEQLHLFLIEAS